MDLREAIAFAMLEQDEVPVMAAMKSYLDGYQTGLSWKETYLPGGPWKYAAYEHESDRIKRMAHESQEAYRQWHDGFKAGLARNKNKKV